jgi:DNA-3-methyladenine glycosylase II
VDISSQIRRGETCLRKTDDTLARLIDMHGPCDLMCSPRPHFHTLVWAIINQQLSVKAARTIEERLLAYLDTDIVSAEQLLDLEALESLDDDQVSAVLMGLPGVGRWTADMLLMFSLGRLDVLPIGDLALRKSVSALYKLSDDSSTEDFLVVTESWRPYRSIASWYCWAAVD